MIRDLEKRSCVCDCCGAENARPYYYSDSGPEILCRSCAHRRAIYSTAFDQLEHAVRAAYDNWFATWGDLEGMPDADEMLSQIGYKLHAEQTSLEDVQPVRVENAAD